MRYQSYLNTAVQILESYNGILPFSIFIKQFFSNHKKYGSSDRKQISSLCYAYFRLGKSSFENLPLSEKIIVAHFLCEQKSTHFLQALKPSWDNFIDAKLADKINFLKQQNEIKSFHFSPFTLKNVLSNDVDINQYSNSFLQQPSLYLRIRPNKKNIVISKLNSAKIEYSITSNDCIELQNSTKINDILQINKEVVVQDFNSQKVLNILRESTITHALLKPISVWDCCAASGGKSILLFDILDGKINLTVSDIRTSILANLKKRFNEVGIKNFSSKLINVTDSASINFENKFSIIICDAPCTGSGTWARTPEQLYFFDEKLIHIFSEKQKKIASNSLQQLNENGIFIYITCSVFKKENEEVAFYLKEKFHLQILQMEILKGFESKADTMFVAVFKKINSPI